jgi:hypothetical protein
VIISALLIISFSFNLFLLDKHRFLNIFIEEIEDERDYALKLADKLKQELDAQLSSNTHSELTELRMKALDLVEKAERHNICSDWKLIRKALEEL